MKAPFPWFGGKRRVADVVWGRLGDVNVYAEPFAGSCAVLLERPAWHRGYVETVNDLDGFVANVWRAIAADPDGVARYADWPVNENDLHARHAWLVEQREDLTARLEGDPEWFDVRIAGWWLWGIACWIGGGWCSGTGSWTRVTGDDGTTRLVHLGGAGRGVARQRVDLGGAGRGVARTRIHLSTANPNMRIALCGYDGEHNQLEEHGWTVHAWSAHGGMSRDRGRGSGGNNDQERIWFSPACLSTAQARLFDEETA